MIPHCYGSDPGCMYCDASRTEAGNACAAGAAVEAQWTDSTPGTYDPDAHLRALVGGLRHRMGEPLTVELLTSGPEVRFVVRRGPEMIAQATNIVRHTAAREAIVRLLQWHAHRRGT